ncbi:response regulator transcription factor [Zunongwangia sp.]|uniref:response regulator transcription factor n=1 Tax=Zunongwangia sp. TaxID=1965325 RepID=UPI003AA80442
MNILIVEDEDGIVGFLKQGLEEEGYQVDVASEGRSGLQKALIGKYDLLLLDWMLPGVSGIEICRQFRKEDKDTPVIFLTAKDTLDETIFGLQSGANDYIKKPFHFEELLERIKVQLRPKSGDHTIFSLGSIILNTATHQAFKNGEEVSLTLKEFTLLEYLIRNKERVCTRTKIIEKVWDINFSYNTGVIDVYINALRKKLELGQKENYIQTVRGVGYIAKEI